MPNRILKESICTSPTVDQLSEKAENLFYRLIVNMDDYGRLDGRIVIVLTRCYPLRIKILTELELINLLIELSNAKLITIYTKDNEPFIQMCTWDKHQQIRAKKSKYPAYDDTCKQLIADVIREQLLSDNICLRNPIQSNPIVNVIQSLPIKNNGYEDIEKLANTEVLANKELTYTKTDNEGNIVKDKPIKKQRNEVKFGNEIGEIFKFLDTTRGYKPTKRKAEAGAIIRMLSKNYTVEQITTVWKQMKSNDFRFRDRELYMMSVESDIGAKLSTKPIEPVNKSENKTILTKYKYAEDYDGAGKNTVT